MNVWLVIQVGIYKQRIGGVFSSYQQAKNQALSLIQQEPDDHHGYDIYPFKVDEVIPFDDANSLYAQGPKEPESVCWIYRKRTEILIEENM